jgi:hypothetical protein
MVCFTGRPHCPAARGIRLGPADPQAERVSRPSLPFPARKHSLLTRRVWADAGLSARRKYIHKTASELAALYTAEQAAALGAAYEACMRPPAAELRALGSRLGLGWNDVSQYFRKRRGLDLAPSSGADAAPSGMRPECSAGTASNTHPRTLAWAAKRHHGTHSCTLGRLRFRGAAVFHHRRHAAAQIRRCRVLLRCARPIRCSAAAYTHTRSLRLASAARGCLLGLAVDLAWRLQAHARLPRRPSTNNWRAGTKAMPSNRRACLLCARRTAR